MISIKRAVLMVCVLVFGSALAFGDSKKSRLSPPEGGPEGARGEVQINPEKFEVRVHRLDEETEYGVFLDDGAGELVEIGAILTNGGGGGKLKLGEDDSPLPLDAMTPDQLAGRAIEVRDGEGAVVLAGTTPDIRFSEKKDGVTVLELPDPPVDEDAGGEIKLRQKDGRMVIKVSVRDLEPEAVYEVVLTDPESGDEESLGAITTKEEGEGKLKIDTKKGDSVPFGVGSLCDLVGFGARVDNAEEATVLQATIEPLETKPDDDKDEDEEEGESCLTATDPESGARGEVELEVETEDGAEKSKLKIKAKDLEPAAVYDVELRNPADEAVAAVGQFTTNDKGRGELRLESPSDEELPFGVGSLAELVGFGVVVKDMEGNEVLTGAVAELGTEADCDDDDDEDDEDDAPELEIKTKIKGDGEELEIEVEHLDPETSYDVVIRDPAGGDPEVIDTIVTNAVGKAELELETEDGDTLPLGAESVADLEGFQVDIVDAAGEVVLTGTVGAPEVKETGGGGTSKGMAPVAEIDPFAVVGDFDSEFLRGDSNSDLQVDLADAAHSLEYLFLAGERPLCLDAADSNDDGEVDIADPVGTLMFLFQGQPLPGPGSFVAGFDWTVDTLHCLEVSTP